MVSEFFRYVPFPIPERKLFLTVYRKAQTSIIFFFFFYVFVHSHLRNIGLINLIFFNILNTTVQNDRFLVKLFNSDYLIHFTHSIKKFWKTFIFTVFYPIKWIRIGFAINISPGSWYVFVLKKSIHLIWPYGRIG